MRSRIQLVSAAVLAAAVALAAGTASAWAGGISAATFGASGCPGCHGGGAGTTTASIAFTSPIVSGVANTITVTVANASQSGGGFNLQLSGGSFAGSPGAGVHRWSGTEVSHSTPDTTAPYQWSISWTPGAAGPATYTLWANAVNLDGDLTLDTPRGTALSSTVTILQAQGTSCSSGAQCGTGHCINGVCCNNGCTGPPAACYACNLAGSVGTCSPRPAGTACCPTGYSWNGSSCVVSNACAAGTADCVAIATCVPGGGSAFTCTCPHAGYQGNGRTSGSGCTNIDECASNPCAPFGAGGQDGMGCTERALGSWSPPGYTCTCQPGYDSNGTTCTLEDECSAGLDDCHPVAVCADPTDAPGDFTCTCPSGYTGTGHGALGCADVNECALGLDDCHANATCTNTIGSFTCACNTGYTGNGRACADIDECLDPVFFGMCDVNSTCNNLPGSFECRCNTGWRGDGLVACADVDECAEGSHDCDPNATCGNTPGSWTCACDAGWDGDGRTCVDIDECLDMAFSSRCSTVAACVNEPGSWRCACNAGYRGDGFTCEDVDECAEGTATCDPNATCENTIGAYRCTCDMYWRGSGFDCVDVDECAERTHVCAASELCQNQVGAPATCTCAPGYTRGDDGVCFTACGDAMVGRGELCDDGNRDAGDGCDAFCQIEPGWACVERTGTVSTCYRTCGDGFIDPSEACDDGAANSDTAADACRTDCTLPRCGDGATDTGEECDDGAANDDDAPDACRTSCHRPFCGDGVVDATETCDPGNGVPGASIAGTCTSLCAGDAGIDEADPPILTGGACAAARPGRPAPTLLVLALAAWLVRRRRRAP
ncbi:MAG: DUF4215 domain-containing protein [Sandaracinaceae bacterium]|nr:DUF4215 domain-containing protein [Sandaracinaceae bacterium]